MAVTYTKRTEGGPPRLALVFVFVTALMDSIGFGIVLPVLPDLLMEITGEDVSSAAVYGGWLLFIYAIMQFLMAPALGNLSDAYGRRPVLLISLTVLAINYVIMGLTETLWLLVLGRMISGAGAATFSTCNAYIADVTLPEERAQYFGLMGAAFGMGFVIGPVIGGFLGEFGPRVPFFAAAVLLALNFLLGYFALPESHVPENRRPFRASQANPINTFSRLSKFHVVFGLMGVMFLYNLSHHALPSVFSYYTIERYDWSARDIGYSLGAIGLMMTIVQGFLIRFIIPWLGLRIAAVAGFTLMTVSFVGYAAATEGWMLYVAMVPGALAAIAGPSINGIASAQVGADQQGELQGGFASLMSLTSIISPPVMTMTFSLFTGSDAITYLPGAPFLLSAALTVLALILLIRTTARLPVANPA